MAEPGNLTGYVDRYRQAKIARLLEAEYPTQCASMSSEALRRITVEGYEDAVALDITAPDDIHRFIRLRFLPDELLRSPYIQGVLIRILNNRGLSGAGRLDLIERGVGCGRWARAAR
jgi:hypothetical protein